MALKEDGWYVGRFKRLTHWWRKCTEYLDDSDMAYTEGMLSLLCYDEIQDDEDMKPPTKPYCKNCEAELSRRKGG